MSGKGLIGNTVFLLFLFAGTPVIELNAQPEGVPMGGCKEWINGTWVQVPCGSSNNPPAGGNTGYERIPRTNKKLEEKNEKIRKANDLFHQAQDAAKNNNAKEALRLARAAQDMANDHKWLKDWINSLEDYIANEAIRKKADVERINGDAAFIRGDLAQALAFYKQALAIDAGSLSDFGKNRVKYIEDQLQKEKEQKQIDKITANKLIQDMQLVAGNLKSAEAPRGLNFMVNDPMIADANNVPSELPKAVMDAIPLTPAGDRLRNGFQAIFANDWKVALAWFQDALNKESGNPSLQRLVDLAQFTLNYRLNVVSPAFKNETLSVKTESIPNHNAPKKSADNKEVISVNDYSKDGFMAYSAASQMAARARAQIAFEQYNKEHAGRINVLERAKVTSRALRGEGYSKEELNAQYQKALLEYNKFIKSKKNVQNVGGNPAIEEIIIGLKG